MKTHILFKNIGDLSFAINDIGLQVKADKSPEKVKYFVQEEIKGRLNKNICCYGSSRNIFCSCLVSKTQTLKYKEM
jgi:hypothetical protein